MSDTNNETPRPDAADDVAPYEPPMLTPIGNARDLLAGGLGTTPDGSPFPPNNQQFS